MYNPRNLCFYSFSASVSFDFETRIMSTCMSTSRSNYTDMSIWKKHADHSTSFYPCLGVKTPTLLVIDIITMGTSIAFVVTFMCFIFHKAWIYHSIASETFLFLYKFFENCTFYCACEFRVIISCFGGKKWKSLLKLLNSVQVLSKIK